MLRTPGVIFIDLRVASEVDQQPLLTLEDGFGRELARFWMPSMLDTVCDHIDQAIVSDIIPCRKTTPIVCYCGSGRRAALAAGRLHARGYQNVVNAGSAQDMQKAIKNLRDLHSPRVSGSSSFSSDGGEVCEVGACAIA